MAEEPPSREPRRTPPKRGPSPILIPEGPEQAEPGRLKTWLGNLRRDPSSGPAPSTPPPVGEAELEPLPEPEASAHRATLQMLPGRLEPLDPEVIEQEVRFQRGASGDQVVTLGWEMIPPPEHVTLDHPSIRPLHARMTFRGGTWMVESLDPDHPVEVNGAPLSPAGGPLLLADGDLIRIGEAFFRFWMP